MRRGSTGRAGSALVVLDDYRAALAATLLLQELDFAVDVAVDEASVLSWVKQARYDLLLCGAGPDQRPEAMAMRLRRAAPAARVVMLAPEGTTPADLRPLGIEVVYPPITVNVLMDRLWRTAA
jgi:DNA-binding response OmpR family regulator